MVVQIYKVYQIEIYDAYLAVVQEVSADLSEVVD